MRAINFEKCQQNELRNTRHDVFNCGNGVKDPLPELKVNGPGGYMRTADSSDSVID